MAVTANDLMAQLVVLTTKGYIDHDRLISPQGITPIFETGSLRGIQPHHAARLQYLLTTLNAADEIGDMDEIGFNLHVLKGFKTPHCQFVSMEIGD